MNVPPTNRPPDALMQNALGVLAQSGLTVHEELKKTTEAYQEHINKTEAVIEEQAARIAALEARLAQAEAHNQQLVVIHKSEVDPLRTLNAQLHARVKYLEGDVQDRQRLLNIYSKDLHDAKYVLGNLCAQTVRAPDVCRRNWSDARRIANEPNK